ncbi:MAG: hypothetical protein KF779_00070 [Hyphomonadaceae bacterium]|nr:hypothetical protein [Hyphomonadaceae bacterium]
MSHSIPKGWTQTHLGELFKERKESGVDGLPTMSVTMHDGLVIRNGLDRRMETTLDASSHLLVRRGDIAYNMMRMWQGACGLAAQDCIVSPAYVVLTPSASIDPRYFVAWSKSARGLHLLWAYSHGLTDDRRRLYFDDFCQIPIDLPPIAEQRRIADALAVWSRAIDTAEVLVAAQRRQRDWLRANLLTGRSRVSGHSGNWTTCALGHVLTEHGLNASGGEVVYSVSVHKGLINQVEHLGRSFAAADTSNYNRVLPGDVVYTKSPTGDFPFGIIKQSTAASSVIVSPLYGVFTPATKALGIILDAIFESPIVTQNFLTPLVQKGAKNTIAITNRRFLEGELALPLDPSEQIALASIFSTSKQAIRSLEEEIDFLTEQKRGLMQKLLTGEWRLPTRPSERAA